MKIIAFLFITTLHIGTVVGQDAINLNDILETRWVLIEEHNMGPVDHLEILNFAPYKSLIAEETPIHLQHGGLTFKSNGLLIVHQYNRCGTGNPPDYLEAGWEANDGKNWIIVVTENSRWNGSYKILFLSADSMKLERIH